MIGIKPADILKFAKDHLPTILSCSAVAGVIGTGVLSYRAANKVAAVQQDYCSFSINEDGEPELSIMTEKETFKNTWKYYIPPVACGAVTIACIVMAEKIHLNNESALAAALAIWEAKYNKLDEKMVEALGVDKANELKREIVDDDIRENHPPKEFIENDGKMLCYEPYTKQWFRASKEQLLWAELTANKMFATKGGVKLNDVLELYPGCKRMPAGNKIGWFLDDFGNYNAAYFFPGVGHQWIEIAPQLRTINGIEVMALEYSLNPYEPDEPEEWS